MMKKWKLKHLAFIAILILLNLLKPGSGQEQQQNVPIDKTSSTKILTNEVKDKSTDASFLGPTFSSNPMVKLLPDVLKSNLTSKQEVYNINRKRRPSLVSETRGEGFQSPKNSTAVQIILQKIRRAQELKKNIYHDPLSRNKSRKRLVRVRPRVKPPQATQETLTKTTAPILVTNEKLLEIVRKTPKYQKDWSIRIKGDEDQSPNSVGSSIGRRLKQLRDQKKTFRSSISVESNEDTDEEVDDDDDDDNDSTEEPLLLVTPPKGKMFKPALKLKEPETSTKTTMKVTVREDLDIIDHPATTTTMSTMPTTSTTEIIPVLVATKVGVTSTEEPSTTTRRTTSTPTATTTTEKTTTTETPVSSESSEIISLLSHEELSANEIDNGTEAPSLGSVEILSLEKLFQDHFQSTIVTEDPYKVTPKVRRRVTTPPEDFFLTKTIDAYEDSNEVDSLASLVGLEDEEEDIIDREDTGVTILEEVTLPDSGPVVDMSLDDEIVKSIEDVLDIQIPQSSKLRKKNSKTRIVRQPAKIVVSRQRTPLAGRDSSVGRALD